MAYLYPTGAEPVYTERFSALTEIFVLSCGKEASSVVFLSSSIDFFPAFLASGGVWSKQKYNMSGGTKLVRPNNNLKEKVGSGGFNPADIEKAQSMIENNTIDFVPIAKDFLRQLDQILKEIQSGAIGPGDALGSITYPLMQLPAQGSLFHYPLITALSDVVVDFLDGAGKVDNEIMEIISSGYLEAAQAILTLKIKNPTDKAGNALCKELRAACSRYKAKSA